MNAPEPIAHPAPLEKLPFDNGFAALPEAFYTRLEPASLPAPYVVGVSAEVAELIGLDPEEAVRPEFAEVFAGNRRLPGSAPLAHPIAAI